MKLAIRKSQAQNSLKNGVYIGCVSGHKNEESATKALLGEYQNVSKFRVVCDDEESGTYDMFAFFSNDGIFLNGVYPASEVMPEEKNDFIFFEGEIEKRFAWHNAAHVINDRGLAEQI